MLLLLTEISAAFSGVRTVLLFVCHLVWLLGRAQVALLAVLCEAAVILYEAIAAAAHDLSTVAVLLLAPAVRSANAVLHILLSIGDATAELLQTGRIPSESLPGPLADGLRSARDGVRDFIRTVGDGVWLAITLPLDALLFGVRAVCVVTRSCVAAVIGFFGELPAHSLLSFGLLLAVVLLRRHTVPLLRRAALLALRSVIVPAAMAAFGCVRREAGQLMRHLHHRQLPAVVSVVAAWMRWPLLRWQNRRRRRPHRRRWEDDGGAFVGQQQQKPEGTAVDNAVCMICADQPKNVVLLPCRHFCLCAGCSQSLLRFYDGKCPLCRRPVEQTMLVFA